MKAEKEQASASVVSTKNTSIHCSKKCLHFTPMLWAITISFTNAIQKHIYVYVYIDMTIYT